MKLELKDEQERLRDRVVCTNHNIQNRTHVTGVDVSYHDDMAFGAAVTLDIDDNSVLGETQVSVSEVREYVPGQFYLREGPVLERLLAEHKVTGPVLVDANGILHPRRFGLASHIGVRLNIVTIGVAKTLLLGQAQERINDTARIIDKGELVGMALWLGQRETPLYVSVGHRISLHSAVAIVRASSFPSYPEPLQLADRLSRENRRLHLANVKSAALED